ncbi:MAG: aspartate carbamoyltransferase [Ectothiorhodospiraceae bacterium AqS1]|nr:aspartate carbamoyltransferase [Ectothiorhodospiraceae bacterium AqS1]
MKKSVSAARLVAFSLPLSLALVACAPVSMDRQAMVAQRGAHIMPFDLDRTTHIFEKRQSGGLQQVLSDDGDAEQIRLVREHLGSQAMRFSEGDFHHPAMIHGHDMPGLHALTMGAGRLRIVYDEIDNGAQILYSAADPDLIEAIHIWFDRQLSDHGSHAQAHSHSHSH